MKIFYQSAFERWPFEDNSIQAIITSPPYYAVRRYNIPSVVIGGKEGCSHEWGKDDFCSICNGWKGQHGLEPTPLVYLKHCMLWIKEAWRVLKNDGCLFINIADSYNNKSACIGRQDKSKYNLRGGVKLFAHKTKMLIPERLMVMMQDSGWVIRNHIVWHKSNALPESVQDRFARRWESIIFATKSPQYQFILDNVREPYKETSLTRFQNAYNEGKYFDSEECKRQKIHHPRAKFNIRVRDVKKGRIKGPMHKASEKEIAEYDLREAGTEDKNYLGKNPGDVWTLATESSSLKHYAMFPERLAERMVLCSTKPGDIVLDPFCGSGTTLRVADKLNRIGYGIDLGYAEVQKERLSNIQKVLLY